MHRPILFAWAFLMVAFIAPPTVYAIILLAAGIGGLFVESILFRVMQRIVPQQRAEAALAERENWILFFDEMPNGEFDWAKVRCLVQTYGWDIDAWHKHHEGDTHAQHALEGEGPVPGVREAGEHPSERDAGEARDQAEP